MKNGYGAAGPLAGEIYTLPELGIRLMLPKGYAVITRDTDPDDPVFLVLAV